MKNFLIREQYQLSIRVEHTWILVLCYNCLATLRIFHAADFKVLVGSHSFSKYPSFRRLKSFLYCGINGKCKCKFLSVADNNTNTKWNLGTSCPYTTKYQWKGWVKRPLRVGFDNPQRGRTMGTQPWTRLYPPYKKGWRKTNGLWWGMEFSLPG